jgi:hypothetical protein
VNRPNDIRRQLGPLLLLQLLLWLWMLLLLHLLQQLLVILILEIVARRLLVRSLATHRLKCRIAWS